MQGLAGYSYSINFLAIHRRARLKSYPKLSRQGGNSEVLFDDMLESDNGFCVKLDAGPALQLIKPFLKRSPGPVRAVGSNGVKRVGHGHDSCQKGDLMVH